MTAGSLRWCWLAMVLAGGLAYRLFFWVLALSLVISGVLGFFDPSSVDTSVRNAGFGIWIASALARIAGSAAGNEWWLLLIGIWLFLWTGYTTAKAPAGHCQRPQYSATVRISSPTSTGFER